METLEQLLINKRTGLKLSLRNAADKIGVSHSYLSTLEKGIDPRSGAPVKPTPDTLKLISNAYSISYQTLMELSGYLNGEITSEEDSVKKSNTILTKKDEKDIAKDLENTLNQLEDAQDGLMFDGEALDDETRELLKISLENSMRLAKQIAKKYTPNKYKK